MGLKTILRTQPPIHRPFENPFAARWILDFVCLGMAFSTNVTRGDRIRSLFGRGQSSSPRIRLPVSKPYESNSLSSVDTQSSSTPNRSGDTLRTNARYEEASKLLEEVINERKDLYEPCDFSCLAGDLENWSNSQFSEYVDGVLEKQRIMVKDRTLWRKCEQAIQCFFAAFSPLAKNILRIGTDSLSVCACFLSADCIDAYPE